MELKDYIKNAIVQISEAIVEAQSELNVLGVIINPEKVEIGKDGKSLLRADGWRYLQNLDFEVLITTAEENGTEVKGGLKIANLIQVGGKSEDSSALTQANKLRFSIPVAFPTTQTPPQYLSKKGNFTVL